MTDTADPISLAAVKATEGKRLTYRPLTKKRKGTLDQLFPGKA